MRCVHCKDVFSVSFSHFLFSFTLALLFSGYAVTNICPAVFCMEPPVAFLDEPPYQFNDDDLATFAIVKTAFSYGSTAFMTTGTTTDSDGGRGEEEEVVLDTTLKGGSGVPFLMVFGAGDDNYSGEDQRGWKTYQQWDEGENGNAKAFLVIEGLDRSGITDFPETFQQNTTDCTLPSETQVQLLVDSVVVWTDTALAYYDDSEDDNSRLDDFCEDVILALNASNVELCVPESDDDRDDVRKGMQVGGPVAAFGVLMVLFLGMFMKQTRSARTSVSHHHGSSNRSKYTNRH